jgi:hypothetical protein
MFFAFATRAANARVFHNVRSAEQHFQLTDELAGARLRQVNGSRRAMQILVIIERKKQVQMSKAKLAHEFGK